MQASRPPFLKPPALSQETYSRYTQDELSTKRSAFELPFRTGTPSGAATLLANNVGRVGYWAKPPEDAAQGVWTALGPGIMTRNDEEQGSAQAVLPPGV